MSKEFKEIFITEYDRGEFPRNILKNHGFDIATLGERRVWSISGHIREEYRKSKELHSDYQHKHNCAASSGPGPNDKSLSDKDEIKQLRHEVEYMKQEIEFLKKISSIKYTQK